MTKLLTKAYTWVESRRNHNDEEGQTIIEYALIVAVVSVALIAGMLTFGQSVITAAASAVDGAISD